MVRDWQQVCLQEMDIPIWQTRANKLTIIGESASMSQESTQLFGAILQFLKLSFEEVSWAPMVEVTATQPTVWWLGGSDGVQVEQTGGQCLLKTVSLSGFLAEPLLKKQLFHVLRTWQFS